MSLKKYIAESERIYSYRLKTVVALGDDAMDVIERVLLKYQPVDISRPRKLMMQKAPLDFPQIEAAEIYVVDFEVALPASPYVVHKEMIHALHCHGSELVVRGYNDPTEVESERLNAVAEMDEEAKADGKVQSSILNDPMYEDGQETPEVYGDSYNKKFLSYLRKAQKEREEAAKIDPANPLFSWMDMPKGEADDNGAFNANIDGAPTIGDPNGEASETQVANQGNLTDRKRTYKRLYGKNGARTMSSRDVDTQKDPK